MARHRRAERRGANDPSGDHQVLEAHPRAELHGQIQGPVLGLAEVVDGNNIRVGQEARGARLALEAPDHLRGCDDLGAYELERDGFAEHDMGRPVHGAHGPPD